MELCLQCFKMKGDFEVCPHCGYVENTQAKQAYQLSPGTVLRRRYIIGVSIGFGGFGITYKAFDTLLGVIVAVKEFYPAGLVNRGEGEVKVGIFSGEKEEDFNRQLKRFLEEARNLAIFSKEKDIINVYDYFEENQTAYIIMEYVDAPLLKVALRERGRFSEEEAKSYVLAILSALEKIHYHGIIHKDISPDNIFLTGKDSVKIFDFGAAKFQGTQSERTEAVVVKAGYTPPEQYRSKNEQGAFMDIYAVGAVFYEMVTGEKPMDAPDRAVEDNLKKPSELGIEIDDKLERVILKAMALKPEMRFQTVEQFKNAIVSEKRVELPEEEIKRHRTKKRLLVAGACTVFTIAVTILALSQTVFSSRGKVDVAKIKEDTLDVWLMADEDEGKELSRTLAESVEKECPQLTVNIEVIGKEGYADKIQKAAKEKKLPQVFCTDSVSPEEFCTDLRDLICTMELSSYLYLEKLENEKSVCELPTAVQTGVAFFNQIKTDKTPEMVEIEMLEDNDWRWRYGDETSAYEEFRNSENDVSVIVGDLSDMDRVREATIEQMPPTDFSVAPVLKNGRLIGLLKNHYGVSKDATQNQKKAGMFLISLLLSDGLQSALYMDNENGMPLNRSVYKLYQENKMTTYLSFFKRYDIEDAVLYGGESICQILKEQIEGNGT